LVSNNSGVGFSKSKQADLNSLQNLLSKRPNNFIEVAQISSKIF